MPDILPNFPPNSTILFQGDSITDGGRWHTSDPNHYFGQGYMFIVAAHCGARHPKSNWTFVNRGISGNKVTDLAARWQTDTLDINPDVLSILIGINDSLNDKDPGAAAYEIIYSDILQQTVESNPSIKIILCEPFALPVGYLIENYISIAADVKQRQDAVARLASKFNATIVPLQRAFDEACDVAPAEYWLWDGIHPTAAGNQLIADEWLKAATS